jgi:hypothetical protein
MCTSFGTCLLYLVCDNKEKIDSKDFFNGKMYTQSPDIYILRTTYTLPASF